MDIHRYVSLDLVSRFLKFSHLSLSISFLSLFASKICRLALQWINRYQKKFLYSKWVKMYQPTRLIFPWCREIYTVLNKLCSGDKLFIHPYASLILVSRSCLDFSISPLFFFLCQPVKLVNQQHKTQLRKQYCQLKKGQNVLTRSPLFFNRAEQLTPCMFDGQTPCSYIDRAHTIDSILHAKRSLCSP